MCSSGNTSLSLHVLFTCVDFIWKYKLGYVCFVAPTSWPFYQVNLPCRYTTTDPTSSVSVHNLSDSLYSISLWKETTNDQMIAWWIILSTAMTLVLSCVWCWHECIKQNNSVKLFINNTRWVSNFNVQGSPRRYPCLTVVVPNDWARQSWQTTLHSNRWAIFSMLVELCCYRKIINDMAVDIAWHEDYPVSEYLQLTLSKTLPFHYLHTSSKIFWKLLL